MEQRVDQLLILNGSLGIVQQKHQNRSVQDIANIPEISIQPRIG